MQRDKDKALVLNISLFSSLNFLPPSLCSLNLPILFICNTTYLHSRCPNKTLSVTKSPAPSHKLTHSLVHSVKTQNNRSTMYTWNSRLCKLAFICICFDYIPDTLQCSELFSRSPPPCLLRNAPLHSHPSVHEEPSADRGRKEERKERKWNSAICHGTGWPQNMINSKCTVHSVLESILYLNSSNNKQIF